MIDDDLKYNILGRELELTQNCETVQKLACLQAVRYFHATGFWRVQQKQPKVNSKIRNWTLRMYQCFLLDGSGQLDCQNNNANGRLFMSLTPCDVRVASPWVTSPSQTERTPASHDVSIVNAVNMSGRGSSSISAWGKEMICFLPKSASV